MLFWQGWQVFWNVIGDISIMLSKFENPLHHHVVVPNTNTEQMSVLSLDFRLWTLDFRFRWVLHTCKNGVKMKLFLACLWWCDLAWKIQVEKRYLGSMMPSQLNSQAAVTILGNHIQHVKSLKAVLLIFKLTNSISMRNHSLRIHLIQGV